MVDPDDYDPYSEADTDGLRHLLVLYGLNLPVKLPPVTPSVASILHTFTRRRNIDVDGKEILVGWLSISDSNILPQDRRGIEELVAQAAVKYGETVVHIDSGIRKKGREVNNRRNEYNIVHYDEHIIVSFPEMNRKAHVYVVRENGEFKFRPLRRHKEIDKRPAVVLIE